MLHPIQTPLQLAPHLRALRQTKGLSQEKLGETLGLSQARVARIENAPLNISVRQLLQFLAAVDAGLVLESAAGTGTGPGSDKSNAGDW